MTTPTGTTASVARTLTLIDKDAARGSSCSPDLTRGPWAFDAGLPAYGPGASQDDAVPADAPVQGRIPEEYQRASDEELHARISAARQTLGERVVVLGHFYQRDEVVQHADFVGDSFQLARASQGRPEAEAIVFCGVHFMAETADLLSTPDQAVILPNLAAGCSMADMADLDSVEDAWEQLEAVYGTEPDDDGRVPLLPVTYMNSSAALKGFVGERGGIVCTSSNASAVLDWAFERAQRVLFFPDQHLGRNTGRARGIPLEQMPTWNPRLPLGGNSEDALRDAKVLLWHGFCSVHRRFTVAQIEQARAEHPDVQVIVHPECPLPVVEAADSSGSTDFIVKAIQAAPALPGHAVALSSHPDGLEFVSEKTGFSHSAEDSATADSPSPTTRPPASTTRGPAAPSAVWSASRSCWCSPAASACTCGCAGDGSPASSRPSRSSPSSSPW